MCLCLGPDLSLILPVQQKAKPEGGYQTWRKTDICKWTAPLLLFTTLTLCLSFFKPYCFIYSYSANLHHSKVCVLNYIHHVFLYCVYLVFYDQEKTKPHSGKTRNRLHMPLHELLFGLCTFLVLRSLKHSFEGCVSLMSKTGQGVCYALLMLKVYLKHAHIIQGIASL